MSDPYDWHDHVPTLKDIVIGCTVYAVVLALLVVVCSSRQADTGSRPGVAVAEPPAVDRGVERDHNDADDDDRRRLSRIP